MTVEPESRCPGNRYDRNEYGSRYRSKEDDIIDELGAIYGPYSGRCFESDRDTQIEHIVAINEAHTSGMCAADTAPATAAWSCPAGPPPETRSGLPTRV